MIVTENGIEREATQSEVERIEAQKQRAMARIRSLERKTALQTSVRAKLVELGFTDDEVSVLIG